MHTENVSYLDCFVGQCCYHTYTVNIGGCICYTLYNCTLSHVETIAHCLTLRPLVNPICSSLSSQVGLGSAEQSLQQSFGVLLPLWHYACRVLELGIVGVP